MAAISDHPDTFKFIFAFLMCLHTSPIFCLNLIHSEKRSVNQNQIELELLFHLCFHLL